MASDLVSADIRASRKDLERKMAAAKAEIARVLVDFCLLRSTCPHENAVTGSHMGESCRHCPDCGAHDL